jgi:formylmethanofuran dehydrogenase subunit E
MRAAAFAVSALLTISGEAASFAETPEEWISLGARVHGGFGSHIPVGIRIGEDALQRLHASRREVTVVYYDSDKSPCACIADGIALATVATVGQRTLQIAQEKAPEGAMAMIAITKKGTSDTVIYTVSDSWVARLKEINAKFDPAGRYREVMQAEGLFEVRAAP